MGPGYEKKGLLKRLITKSDAQKATAGEDTSDTLSEHSLVALSALYYCHPDVLKKPWLYETDPAPKFISEIKDNPAMAQLLKQAFERHLKRFKKWPPSEKARQRFMDILTEIRVI